MTQPIVTTITDEQLAELEAFASDRKLNIYRPMGWAHSVRCGNHLQTDHEYLCAASPEAMLGIIARLRAAEKEAARLNEIINSPQSNDFLRAVSTEAEHQRQRWGSDHDQGKSPSDWFWLVGYLAGKALHAHAAGSTQKAEHHVITTAAAIANWHLSMFGKTDMRPGIDGHAAMEHQP